MTKGGIRMQLAQITHRAHFLDCYPLNEKELKISIQTGRDAAKVFLYAGDPYSAGIAENEQNWRGEKIAMSVEREFSDRLTWSVVITPEYRRVKYHFEIVSGGEHIYLMEDGFYEDVENLPRERMIQRFIYPWMNPADVMRPPAWARDIVWYQIFPERFCRGNQGEKRLCNQPWECREDRSWREFYGGDLNGIRSKLSYIAGLGVSGIYLNPILLSDSNHKYDTIDYTRIDPDFGTEEEFVALVEEAHRLGLRVMIDAVFNHCGETCVLWQDVLKKGPESEYYTWFFVNEWPIAKNVHATKRGDYYAFAFVDDMPKLDTNNPAVMDYLTGIAKHWVNDWKVDGIRFDVGNEISHAFLKYLRLELKQCNPEVYLLGEIWHDSFPWLLGDEYDSVMNYPFLSCVNNFWLDKEKSGRDFMYGINQCYSRYYEQVNEVNFNLLDSHDTDRLMERCHGDENLFFGQLAVLFTMQGSPSIYYGTEIGMDGGGTKANRKCMPWADIENGKYEERIAQIKKLIAIRNQYPQTKSGEIVWDVKDASRMLRYTKKKVGYENLSVWINAGDAEEPVQINEDVKILFARGYEKAALKSGGVLIVLLPESGNNR